MHVDVQADQDNRYWADKAAAFLTEIGIACHQVSKTGPSFLEHVEIKNGEIYFDKVAVAADILHEAGHIATCPSSIRSHLSGDLSEAHHLLGDLLSNCDGDDKTYQQAINTSDPEATAWAYAAGKHVGVPDELIIRDEDYEGTGADIRFGLSLNSYLGINGLHHAGFCTVKNRQYAAICGLPVFPTLAKWLQD